MRILVDENIPLADEIFSNVGKVDTIKGREISKDILIKNKYESLIVRSVTKVNKELLEGSNVKFVGSATAGIDHIDINYLKKHNIGFSNAAGSNANSVVEYIFSAIFNYVVRKNFNIKDLSIGIVGAGNIGERLAQKLEKIGIRVLRNDPPLKEKLNNPQKYYNIEDILKCDIITLHTPLTFKGKYPTYHLFNERILSILNKDALLINSGRGSVVDNNILLEFLNNGKINNVILDVWEDEPYINIELLKKVIYGTPHIAGYSFDGKVNGTIMIYNSLCDFFNIDLKKKLFDFLPEMKNNYIEFKMCKTYEETILNIINQVYDIRQDDYNLRKLILINDKEKRGKFFDDLRKNYPVRREFFNYKIIEKDKIPEEWKRDLKILGFHID